MIKLSFYNDNLYSDIEFISHNSSFEFKNYGFWQRQNFVQLNFFYNQKVEIYDEFDLREQKKLEIKS